MTARRAWAAWALFCALWTFVWAWLAGQAAATPAPGPVWPAGVFAALALASVLVFAFAVPVGARALSMVLPAVMAAELGAPAPGEGGKVIHPTYTLPPRGKHHEAPAPPPPGAVRYEAGASRAQQARRDWGM